MKMVVTKLWHEHVFGVIMFSFLFDRNGVIKEKSK